MTGQLEVPTLVSTGAVTLAGPVQFVNELRGVAGVFTGNMTLASQLNAGFAMFASAVTLSSGLDVVGPITAIGTATLTSAVTLNNVLALQHSVIAGPTIAPLRIIASGASQAFIHFSGGIASTASLNLTGAQMAGIVRVFIDGVGGTAAGFIPVFKGVA